MSTPWRTLFAGPATHVVRWRDATTSHLVPNASSVRSCECGCPRVMGGAGGRQTHLMEGTSRGRPGSRGATYGGGAAPLRSDSETAVVPPLKPPRTRDDGGEEGHQAAHDPDELGNEDHLLQSTAMVEAFAVGGAFDRVN
jgi:hypothetical protein